MTTLEIVQVIAPELATDPNYASFVSLAQARTSTTFFGANYELAVALRAAHSWSMTKRKPGEAGAVTSRRMGPVSTSYAALPGRDSSLSLTTYGNELLDLINGAGPAAAVLGRYEGLSDA